MDAGSDRLHCGLLYVDNTIGAPDNSSQLSVSLVGGHRRSVFIQSRSEKVSHWTLLVLLPQVAKPDDQFDGHFFCVTLYFRWILINKARIQQAPSTIKK